MKIASFNVENMFRRAVVLNQQNWDDGKGILEAYAELTELLQQALYSEDDKKRILELLGKLDLLDSEENEYVVLRRSRGQLIAKHRDGRVEVVAKGRGDWIGWLELQREAVNEQATRNTAAVIADMNPDILAVVEAEDRPALARFNEDVLTHSFAGQDGAWSFQHVMLIDGNDDRGIDVGLLTKGDFPITNMRSHVDDPGANHEPVFSRDCAEYEIEAGGQKLLLMVNHFKSKGYGAPAVSSAKRRAQAERVAAVYKQRLAEGWEHIVVLGDLNDTPDSEPLAPLVKETSLKDASEDPSWVWGEREGTFGSGNEKIDYLLLSPAPFGKVKDGGVDRKGVWHGPQTHNPWEMLPTLTAPTEAASDHAAVWVELDL
jgi:endonuclease/exonuclease/phosphatase family metal-dependent hydrolase